MVKRTIGDKLVLVFMAIVLVIASAIALFPFFWTFVSSLKPLTGLFALNPTVLPDPVFTEWYTELIELNAGNLAGVHIDVVAAFINSMGIGLISTAITMLVASFAAYTFARMRFKGQTLLLCVIFVLWLLPAISTIFPIYLMMRTLHLFDTWASLILVYGSTAIPFVMWIAVGYFQDIPQELEESALVDGSSRLNALLKIIMPLAAPGLLATAFIVFIGNWNEFIFAVTLTFSAKSYTLPMVLSQFQTTEGDEWGLILALSSIIAIPTIMLSLIAQRYLARGVSLGAIKG